jgi:hypothetical protein
MLRQAQSSDGPIVLFCIVRNEEYTLQSFFEHYDRLGINRYIFYDDKSSDRTLDILSSRRDVTIYQSDSNYGDVVGKQVSGRPLRFGSALKQNFFEIFGRNTDWALIVDADEFLCLPGSFGSIHRFADFLSEIGQPYLTASLVDFYPARLEECLNERGDDLFQNTPFFDKGPYFDWSDKVRPRRFSRGIRARLLHMLLERNPALVSQVYGTHAPYLAKTWKVPLVRNTRDVRLISDHEINKVPNCRTSGCLAHFKFTPNILDKIDDAIRQKSYYHLSIEYRFLKAAFDVLGTELLVSEDSVMFRSAQDLVASGHMRFSLL